MSQGRPITLMPTEQEFTTVEAANFLNVSRPFVIKEIEAGRLAHRKVGSHRRIAFEDLLEYAQQMRARQAIVCLSTLYAEQRQRVWINLHGLMQNK